MNKTNECHAGSRFPSLRLNSTSPLQQAIQLALLGLQIRVPTDMLLGDEDVRHGSLARYLLERILEGAAVVCRGHEQSNVSKGYSALATESFLGLLLHTDFVQLHEEELGMFVLEQLFRGSAVRAVALAEDDDAVVVDDLLRL